MGTLAAPRLIGWRAAVKLGRVSNLPTVWSNVIAALALAGGGSFHMLLVGGIALSLLYVGGMYLNDAFDRKIDARERPSRPIPSGEASATATVWLGFAMLALGVSLLATLGWVSGLAGLVLAAVVVVYDLHHKGNPLSPFLMGLCRALVYIASAAAAGAALEPDVLVGAGAMLLFVAGLTLAAKQELLAQTPALGPIALLAVPLVIVLPALFSSWAVAFAFLLLAGAIAFALRLLRRRGTGDVGRAVGLLIAAIALVDALAAASAGAVNAMFVCVMLFVLTLTFQRYISGT